MLHQENFLFNLKFQLYPYEDVDSEAISLFYERVEARRWSLFQDGQIINVEEDFGDLLLNKNMVVNTADEQTVWSLNLFPKLVAKDLSSDEKKVWQIEIYDQNDHDMERIILVDDRVHLESYYLAWKHRVMNFRTLMSDVENLRSD